MTTTIPSPSELDHLTESVDTEIEETLKLWPLPASNASEDPADYVKKLRAVSAFQRPSTTSPEVHESQATYTTRDGTTLRLCVSRPAATSGPLPLFVFYHGGGSCVGEPEMNTAWYRQIAVQHQCVIVAPQYRLAPEFRFPTGVEDCWAALQHAAAHAASYGADPTAGFLLGGESAGAVLSAVLALRARDAPLHPPLTGLYLSAGSYLNPDAVPAAYRESYRARFHPVCLASPLLSQTAKAAFDACYRPDYNSPLYRAALWPTGHAGLPRAYFQACGQDIHRDDSFIYRDMLHRAGVETRLDVYPGCPHCFWFMWPDTAQGKKWQNDVEQALTWLLRR